MKILITGGCGFVGSNLAMRLSDLHQVDVIDNLSRRGSEINLLEVKKKCKFIHGDICIQDDLPSNNYDIIIDAAANPCVLDTSNKGLLTNLLGTYNILNLSKKYGSKIIFLSTSRVYSISELNNLPLEQVGGKYHISKPGLGYSKEGIQKNFPTTGIKSLYGAGKLASEIIIEDFCHEHSISYIINRCGVLCGERQLGVANQGLLAFWTWCALNNIPLQIYGFNGCQTRDFLYIKDFINLLQIQMQNWPKMMNTLYQVGGGLHLCESLNTLNNQVSNIVNPTKVTLLTQKRTNDIPYYCTDLQQLEPIWRPKTCIQEIIEATIKWQKDNQEALNRL